MGLWTAFKGQQKHHLIAMPVAKGWGEGGGASRLGFGGVGGGGDFYEGGFHDPIRVDCMEGQVWVCVCVDVLYL